MRTVPPQAISSSSASPDRITANPVRAFPAARTGFRETRASAVYRSHVVRALGGPSQSQEPASPAESLQRRLIVVWVSQGSPNFIQVMACSSRPSARSPRPRWVSPRQPRRPRPAAPGTEPYCLAGASGGVDGVQLRKPAMAGSNNPAVSVSSPAGPLIRPRCGCRRPVQLLPGIRTLCHPGALGLSLLRWGWC